MATLKLLVWNVEWMNDLFDSQGAFKPDNEKPFHTPGSTVKQRRIDLAGVIDELSPDVVVMVEGPNRTTELQLFFDSDVTGQWQTQIQPTSGSSQLVGCAVRLDTNKFNNANPFTVIDTTTLSVFAPFELDNENDGVIEKYYFERMPLYVELNPVNGNPFRILGLHLKSKGIFDALEWSKWWERSLANRRKIFAQCTQIRLKFLDEYLKDNATKNIPLIVCGDINDGPGYDADEKKILGSGIERLMGLVWFPELCMGNALFDNLSDAKKMKLDFDVETTSFKDPIFNNVYHREWIDHILYTRNKLNWVKEGKSNIDMQAGKIWTVYKHASDHHPITATLEV
jgi:endonuclease/exonuclease/phosphatase family metal-dependent hydrolase